MGTGYFYGELTRGRAPAASGTACTGSPAVHWPSHGHRDHNFHNPVAVAHPSQGHPVRCSGRAPSGTARKGRPQPGAVLRRPCTCLNGRLQRHRSRERAERGNSTATLDSVRHSSACCWVLQRSDHGTFNGIINLNSVQHWPTACRHWASDRCPGMRRSD